jgi:internalin A
VAFPLEKDTKAGGEPTHWLIPELLSEVQPQAFSEFRGAEVKRLRFTCPEALPPGLLPRLIVRTHEMSATNQNWRWRAGVVLEWNDCRALVRLDRQQRQTTVEVIDSSPDAQQSLFDLVRAELEILHGKVKVLEELELPAHPGTWVSADKLRLLEQKGRHETDEPTQQNDLATVAVGPTLDTVESREARRAGYPNPPRRMRLFVSYAHADRRLLKPLSGHLKILGRRGYIQVWEDKQLIAGEEWEPRILEELGQADLVLLIYSTAARASDFMQDKEIPLALSRHGERSSTLIPVPLDRSDCDETDAMDAALRKLMTGTWGAKRIVDFLPRGDGWQQVETAIRRAVVARRRMTG